MLSASASFSMKKKETRYCAMMTALRPIMMEAEELSRVRETGEGNEMKIDT